MHLLEIIPLPLLLVHNNLSPPQSFFPNRDFPTDFGHQAVGPILLQWPGLTGSVTVSAASAITAIPATGPYAGVACHDDGAHHGAGLKGDTLHPRL